jgi:hypothetical protein
MVSLSRRRAGKPGESGQALTEYVLLIALITLVYLLVVRQFRALQLADRLLDPIRDRYATIYRFGSPLAKPPEEGGAFHPRVPQGNSIRLFINPRESQ